MSMHPKDGGMGEARVSSVLILDISAQALRAREHKDVD
jgi:hypothetical protein